jgi:hypothetical protein
LSLPFRFSDQNVIYISYLSHAYYMHRLPHPPWLHRPNNICEAFKLLSSSLCSLLHPPATSPLLGSNILLSTLFSCSDSGTDVLKFRSELNT